MIAFIHWFLWISVIASLAVPSAIAVTWPVRRWHRTRSSQRTVAETVDLVKTRTFLRKARTVQVPNLTLPGTARPAAEVPGPRHVPMVPLEDEEWERLWREINDERREEWSK